MIVDIGGGTTDVATISLGGIVNSQSIRIGGDELNEAIVLHVRKKYNLLIGERTAEDLKIQLGSASVENLLLMEVCKCVDVIWFLAYQELSKWKLWKLQKQ